MTKNLILLLIIFGIISLGCSSTNKFGQNRIGFHIEKMKPNSDPKAYDIIDTSKIYHKISYYSTIDNVYDSLANANLKSKPTYLKFYKNGRVGEFRNADINNIKDFNPKKASSQLYKYKNGKFIIQSYFKHVQCGNCFVKETLNKVSNDTIELIDENSITTYVKMDIPKSYLIYKPDW